MCTLNIYSNCCKSCKFLLEKITKLYDDCSHELHKIIALGPSTSVNWIFLDHRFRKNQRKIVNIFLPINFNICFGAEKNRLIERVLLSTHNICFG